MFKKCCSLVLQPLTNYQALFCGRNAAKENTKLETIRRGALRMGLSYVWACGWAVEQGHLWCPKVLQSVWLRWGCPNIPASTAAFLLNPVLNITPSPSILSGVEDCHCVDVEDYRLTGRLR
jgi:hypothetical protein